MFRNKLSVSFILLAIVFVMSACSANTSPVQSTVSKSENPTATPALDATPTTRGQSDIIASTESPLTLTGTSVGLPVWPTPLPQEPSSGLWIDKPTYGFYESLPALLFEVEFDVTKWNLVLVKTERIRPGFHKLVHRSIANCEIVPTSGMGLAPDWSVEHVRRELGELEYKANRVSHQGALKCVNYCVDIADSYTCFGVYFQDNSQACIQDDERVLASLRDVENPYVP